MKKPKPISDAEQLVKNFTTVATQKGCPPDQILNFLKADCFLQEKQIEMSAAARACDYRCPECDAKFKSGAEIPPDCNKCGPTAVGVGGARGGAKQVKTSELMQFWRRKRLPNSKNTGKFECMIKTADQIRVGDYLIGSSGKPVYITHKTKPEIRQFYRVEFDDGSFLETSDNHKWTVFDLSKRADGEKERGNYKTTVTSEWLSVQNLGYRSQRRFAIPLLSGAVEPMNPTKPPLPPYAIGYWLGNGDRQASTMSCHTQDLDEIKSNLENDMGQKYEHRIYIESKKEAKILFNGWNQKLQAVNWPWHWTENGQRKIRVFNRDNIYVEWRNWSSKDRALLLAGLVDSDGTCVDGHMEFDSKDIALAMLVRSLLLSFGQKVTMPNVKQPKTENRSVMYRIKCYPTIQIFRLNRKAEKLSTIRQPKQYRRYITKVEKCGFHEGVCFTVDSPDHLYVAGQDYILTHNSHWMFSQIIFDDTQRYPGLKVLYLRQSATAAREQIRGLLRAVCHNSSGGKKIEYNYREQAGIIEFPNTSYIIVKHFKDEKDIVNFLGQEYDIIAIEELTTLTFTKFSDLTTCLRSSKPNWRPRLYAAWNWGGVGHQWVMKVFFEPWEKHIQRTTRYILALVTDNKFNNPEYINKLRSLTGWKYKSWFLGDPHFQAGQFFKMWDASVHVYPNERIQGFESKMVSWSCSFDHGLDHPACCHLHGKDAQGVTYTVDEYHENEKVPSEIAEGIKYMLRKHNLTVGDISSFVAGNDCFRRSVETDGTKTIASMYDDLGICMTPAITDRINRWEIMANLLGNPENGVQPTWFIHERCANLIAQIPLAQSHETRIGDIQKMNAVDGEGGDDALECASFQLSSDGDISVAFAKPMHTIGYQPICLAIGQG